MLTLCWLDGNTLLPVSHPLLYTENPKKRLAASSGKVDARSNGAKQRRLAQMKSPEVMLRLLQDAQESAIPACHVLFDTWFCSPSSLSSIHAVGYEVVTVVKKRKRSTTFMKA